MTNIRLFSTGGTIAKRYDELSGELLFDDGYIESMLAQGRCSHHIFQITPLMLKDSLEMDNADRESIKKACKNASQTQILITHGTDTMVQSAQKLSCIKDKTIVLTGAMVPYAFKSSDALFNLAGAILAVQTLSHGVYICMNGQIFLWDNVKKNTKEGFFEKLN